MMIQIDHKFRPFSHIAGTQCLVPHSNYMVQAFPTLLRVLNGPEISFDSVQDFTVQLDLERGCVWVLGKSVRYRIEALPEGLTLTGLNSPRLLATGGNLIPKTNREKLFLGCHKAQDWERVYRRADLQEIGPMLFALGQQVPGDEVTIPDLKSCFLSSFTSLFMPHTNDPMHHGFISPTTDPYTLVRGFYTTLRKFLINDTHILPALPHDWVSGRATGLQMSAGTIDLEWTKGMMRRMVFHPTTDQVVDFVFPKAVQSFRVTKHEGFVLFDRFQK